MELEHMGVDYDHPLTQEERDFLRSWNREDLIEANADKYGDEYVSADSLPDDDYDTWKHKELKAEADSRDPKVEYPSNPNRQQLIDGLRAWDRAHPEAASSE